MTYSCKLITTDLHYYTYYHSVKDFQTKVCVTLSQCRGYDAHNDVEYLFYTEKHGSNGKSENWLCRRITKTGKTEGTYLIQPFTLICCCCFSVG